MVLIFQNLIGNAIKYRRAERTPEINISAEWGDSEWTFCIKDSGIGFDMEQADRIFGVFQRLHSREKYPGTGIALAICAFPVNLTPNRPNFRMASRGQDWTP